MSDFVISIYTIKNTFSLVVIHPSSRTSCFLITGNSSLIRASLVAYEDVTTPSTGVAKLTGVGCLVSSSSSISSSSSKYFSPTDDDCESQAAFKNL